MFLLFLVKERYCGIKTYIGSSFVTGVYFLILPGFMLTLSMKTLTCILLSSDEVIIGPHRFLTVADSAALLNTQF